MPRETGRQDRPGEESESGPSLLDELMTAPEVAALLHMRLSTVEDYARSRASRSAATDAFAASPEVGDLPAAFWDFYGENYPAA